MKNEWHYYEDTFLLVKTTCHCLKPSKYSNLFENANELSGTQILNDSTWVTAILSRQCEDKTSRWPVSIWRGSRNRFLSTEIFGAWTHLFGTWDHCHSCPVSYPRQHTEKSGLQWLPVCSLPLGNGQIKLGILLVPLRKTELRAEVHLPYLVSKVLLTKTSLTISDKKSLGSSQLACTEYSCDRHYGKCSTCIIHFTYNNPMMY